MKNAYAVADLAGLMAKTCESISNLAMSINNAEQNDNTDLTESYKDILLNELENIQHMTISLTGILTDIVAENINHDGSVFQPGELDDDLGDKTEPKPATAQEEEK